MVTRVSISIITETLADDEGNLHIRGSGLSGEVEAILPGEAMPMFITGVSALLPKLKKASVSGSRPSFPIEAFELRETNDPGIARLYLRCATPPGSAPDTESIEFGFSLSWDQLSEMGQKLAAAAMNRPPARPLTRN